MFRINVKEQIPRPNINRAIRRWGELVAALPHFLVTAHQPVIDEDPDFRTILIFRDINDALAIVNEPKNTFEGVRIYLLSPESLTAPMDSSWADIRNMDGKANW